MLIVTSDGFDSLRACFSVCGEKVALRRWHAVSQTGWLSNDHVKGEVENSRLEVRNHIIVRISGGSLRKRWNSGSGAFVLWPRLSEGMLPDIIDELKNRHFVIIGQGRRSNRLDRRVGSSWFVLVLGKVVTSELGCRLSFYGAESEEILIDVQKRGATWHQLLLGGTGGFEVMAIATDERGYCEQIQAS